MKLIVESGSTKTEWAIIEGQQLIMSVFTDGINPFMYSPDAIRRMLINQLPESVRSVRFDQMHYYGAGCVAEAQKKTIRTIMGIIPAKEMSVESDLHAAARALFRHEEGLVCILGTGSNSCHYDGKSVVKNVPPLGFILGDEGGGAVLGKLFLADCLKGLAPESLTQEFFDKYKISYTDVLDKIYRQAYPNRYLATFSTFLAKHVDDEYVNKLVVSNFESFFRRSILQYDYERLPVGFVGSVAYHYRDLLGSVASTFGIPICKIIKSSMEGLIEYHN
ncbi:hypothetical protein [Viscerimonas tarda]